MKKRKLAIALAGVTISTSMFFTGKVFADTPEAAKHHF